MTTPEFPDTNIPAPQGPKPDVRRMKTEDYLNMLADMYGQQAVILAEIERRTRQAGSRSAFIRIPFSAGGTRSDDVPLPQGDWRTAIISVQAGQNASGVIPFVSGMLFPPVTDMAVLPIVNQSPLHVEAATTFAATGFVNVLLSNQAYPLSAADGANITGSVVAEAYQTGASASATPLRTPTVFHSAVATAAGNTAVWTPASGKKFRLMRFLLAVTDNATLAAAGVDTISLQDATTAIGISLPVFIPATAITGLGAWDTGWIDLGNGYLSAAANNALNINLGTALATGNAGILVAGTEE